MQVPPCSTRAVCPALPWHNKRQSESNNPSLKKQEDKTNRLAQTVRELILTEETQGINPSAQPYSESMSLLLVAGRCVVPMELQGRDWVGVKWGWSRQGRRGVYRRQKKKKKDLKGAEGAKAKRRLRHRHNILTNNLLDRIV